MNNARNYLKYNTRCTLLIAVTLVLFLTSTHFAQTTENYTHLKNKFEGTWRNKEAKRSISITFEPEFDFVTLNDWLGKRNSKYTDAYKAYLKNNKLILYAEDGDHHCVYCELDVVNKELIYQCNEALNFKDQFLNQNKDVSKIVFQRKK